MESRVISYISMPPTVTASDSLRSLLPLQTLQGSMRIKDSYSALEDSDPVSR